MKDVIVMSNGEKVSPADAEQMIQRDPVFEHVMLIGEARPKLGLLCVAKINDANALRERANAQLREFPGYVRIAYVTCVSGPWGVDNGLLTSIMKLKRKEVERRYAKEIEAMYANS